MKFTDRMMRLGTESAFETLARAERLEREKGMEVIHLQIGEPDFDTPRNISDAAIKAINDGYTHYTAPAGMLEAREAIAEYYLRLRNVKYHPDQVVITPGSKEVMYAVIMMLAAEGDEVIYPDPGYPIYKSVIDFSGATKVPIPLREENRFRLDVKELKKLVTPRTKLLIINSPENPTSSVLTASDVEEIYKLACDHDFMIMTDEIYSRIVYDAKFVSIAEFDKKMDRVIILDGMSKVYAMCGWRLGWGLMPKDVAAGVVRMQTNITSCATSFIQKALPEALLGSQDAPDKMMAEFRRRRDFIVEGMNQIEGFKCQKPDGAFYVWPNITATGWDSRDLAEYLLTELGVAGLSGTAFGDYGQGYLRFSYANSIENIGKAIDRMKKAMPDLIKKAAK